MAAPGAVPPAARLVLLGDATSAGLDAAIAGLRVALPASATVETFAAEGVTAGDVRAWLAGRVRARPAEESADAQLGASATAAR
jgi:hypothetical protein